VPRWVAPLGVGAHLEHWGVPSERITELDWWEEAVVAGVRIASTPTRHFSGRTLGDRNRTLWCGWALLGADRRIWVSGDGGMQAGFAEIGARLGPFDGSLVETGAYNAHWADIHMGPEQAVEAHRQARGGVLIPVHWGTFDLALHGWTEPAERVLVAAEAAGVSVAVPRPGQSVDPLDPPVTERWWPDLPWQSAEEAPVVSSGLAA
jgi:L-ascorbate metabolism protein UlaG (beta-lactamase superfamily)